MTPRLAAWILGAFVALAVAGGVYWVPIPVSDNLDIIEGAYEQPSVPAAFVHGLHASSSMLRPMRQVQTKILLNIAQTTGVRYHVVFRGYHALLAAALILLFVGLARPDTWQGVAALAFALTVLTGMHTFAGMMREAYPVNHFLLIALACLVTIAVARSSGGVLADVIAVVAFACAALTLESGLLVLAVAAASYASGLPGISRRGLVAMMVLLAGYFVLREMILQMTGTTLGERPTGFGLRMLSGDEQRAMFGEQPLLLYAYTVLSSITTVGLSQPVAGQWTALQAYMNNDGIRSYIIEITTSLAASVLIVWHLVRRTESGRRQWLEPVPVVTVVVLVGSAVMSYAYAKSEIMSAAGVLYALLAYAAALDFLERVPLNPARLRMMAVVAVVMVISSLWAVRAVGLQYKLQRAAHASRSEWVLRLPPFAPAPVAEQSQRLLPTLRAEALTWSRTNPYMLSRRAEVYWGEE